MSDKEFNIMFGIQKVKAIPAPKTFLHPRVASISDSRLKSGNNADAVEAVYKDINNLVKDIHRLKTGKEFDGAPLMQAAFSLTNPSIIVGDLTTKSGKDIQQGYMMMLAGAMIGIRNPKAHSNLKISSEEANRLLIMASHFMYKLDGAKPNARRPAIGSPGNYID